jgi:hypothetical protein
MSFDTAWLDLREPADHAARDAGLLRTFAEALPDAPRIVDLGSGTGSTLRAVSAALPHAQWRLTDHDPALLSEAKRRAPHAETLEVDLARDLSRALSGEADAITASALIDLVSAEWLDALVAGARGRTLYIALSYDGHEEWSPAHEDDAEIFAAFQAHQRGDKGFGPALGPEAVFYLKTALLDAGYQVETAASPWQVGPGPLMESLATGIAGAAQEAGVSAQTAENWLKARRDCAGCSVGHIDLLARLP